MVTSDTLPRGLPEIPPLIDDCPIQTPRFYKLKLGFSVATFDDWRVNPIISHEIPLNHHFPY
jgi:hypothetical protein